VNQALTRNRGGLFLRLDWAMGELWVLHWFGAGIRRYLPKGRLGQSWPRSPNKKGQSP